MKKRKVISKTDPPIIPIPKEPITIPQESVFNQKKQNEIILPKQNEQIRKSSQFISQSIETQDKEQETKELDDQILLKQKENDDLVKGSQYITQSVVVDQQIPICKDYFLTGYCTYGWACKFLHTRDRTLAGYSEDRFAAKQEKDNLKQEEQNTLTTEVNLCPICKKMHSDPVILRCNHVFCRKCAIERFKTDSTCFVCGKETDGIFNKYNQTMK